MTFEEFWNYLPKDLMNKGSKAEARKEWEKLKPDAETCINMKKFIDVKAQVDRKRKNNQEFVPNWRHGCRLLKFRFWEDDLPEVKHERARGALDMCQCGSPIDHGGYKCCWKCYDLKFGNTQAGWT